MVLIGIHIGSDISEIINNAKNAKNQGNTIVQFYVNKFSKKADDVYLNLSKYLKESNLKCVVHSSYTINLARNWDFHSWWIKQLILEIKTAHLLGAIGVVVHMGKQLDLSTNIALNNMYTALEYVLDKTKEYNVRILLETSSGQGSEMFYNLEELSQFIKKIYKLEKYIDKFGICIDTCHIFSAGYDVRGESKIVSFFETFDKIIGLEKIKLVHLNDTKNELGSRIDRHENYTQGKIGLDSIKKLAVFFSKIGVPIILETPEEKINDDLQNLLKIL